MSTLVLIAALNEEEGIGPTIAELRQYLERARILVIDGKSKDRTVEISKELGAEVICQKGEGKGDAIATALCHINNENYVAFTDADYTYPANYVLTMIEILKTRPEVGMVVGNRFNEHLDPTALHNLFYFGNRLLAFSHNLLNGVKMRDPLSGLRVMRPQILYGWKPRSKGFDIEVEMNRQVEKKGYTIVEIPIDYRRRLGEKKLGIKHGFTILRRILSDTMY